MSLRAKGVILNTRLAVRRAAIAADGTVVEQTPVDEGRAEGNWNVAIGSIDETTYEAGARTGGQAVADGKQVINDWKSGTIFISNSLPYIQALEDGSSTQAPNGMVTAAYDSARVELAKAKLLKL